MKIINLTQGMATAVSDCDYEYLVCWKWCYNKRYGKKAHLPGRVRRLRHKDEGPGSKKVLMHRVILERMGFADFAEVDHIDGDPMNNTRGNLRPATSQQNGWNSGTRSDNTSGVPGVNWDKARGKWRASIKGGRYINLGRFTNLQDAINARHKAEVEHFGEFRRERGTGPSAAGPSSIKKSKAPAARSDE